MKLILLGIVQLLILSLIMYLALFRTKKSKTNNKILEKSNAIFYPEGTRR
jgi:hypothetical protein